MVRRDVVAAKVGRARTWLNDAEPAFQSSLLPAKLAHDKCFQERRQRAALETEQLRRRRTQEVRRQAADGWAAGVDRRDV